MGCTGMLCVEEEAFACHPAADAPRHATPCHATPRASEGKLKTRRDICFLLSRSLIISCLPCFWSWSDSNLPHRHSLAWCCLAGRGGAGSMPRLQLSHLPRDREARCRGRCSRTACCAVQCCALVCWLHNKRTTAAGQSRAEDHARRCTVARSLVTVATREACPPAVTLLHTAYCCGITHSLCL